MSEQRKMNVNSFDHVTLICADLEAARQFYVDFLGMNEVSRPAFKFPGLWFQSGNVQIHATQSSPESGKGGWGNQRETIVSHVHPIAFCVNNVSDALKIVESIGVRIASTKQ